MASTNEGTENLAEMVNRRKYWQTFFLSIFFVIPYCSCVVVLAFDSFLKGVSFFTISIIIALAALTLHLINRSFLIWYNVLLVNSLLLPMVAGHFLGLVGSLHAIFFKFSFWLVFVLPLLFFLVYFLHTFYRHWRIYKKRLKAGLLEGIDINAGTIDILKYQPLDTKKVSDSLDKSPLFSPLRFLILVGLPFGYGGAALLASHLKASFRQFVLVLICYCATLLIGHYFSVFLVRIFAIFDLQFTYKKWFKIHDFKKYT
jgi:hypothetical protein